MSMIKIMNGDLTFESSTVREISGKRGTADSQQHVSPGSHFLYYFLCSGEIQLEKYNKSYSFGG